MIELIPELNKLQGMIPDPNLVENLVWGLVLGFIAASASYKLKFLTADGAVAAFILAVDLYGLGGWKWSLPILVFFMTSSFLSRFRKYHNTEVEGFFEKSGMRDSQQVLANGGIGGLLVIFDFIFHSGIFYLVYVGILATVCADTWATEIGTLFRTRTYNILNFKTVEQGVSGGISVPGTTGALLGTLIVAFSASVWINIPLFQYFCAVTLAGLMGCFLDSVLGATVQAGFICSVCGRISEKRYHCDRKTQHKKGIVWFNNDMVNLIAGLSGGVFIIIFRIILL